MCFTNKFLLVFLILFMVGSSTFAASTTDLMNGIAFGAIILTLVLIVVVCFVLLNTFKMMAAMILPKEEKVVLVNDPNYELILEPETPRIGIWQKLLSLRPMSEEKELLIMHDYDEIRELDNPIPAWFNWLFYGTVVFAVVYLLNYHVFNLGKLQEEEYAIEMKVAEKEKEIYLAQSANKVDENTIKIDKSAPVIASGKALFIQNCVACHGENAQGIVGPNLTDEYWIHGGNISSIFKTIKYGVPEKGMISWEKQMSPKQMAEVSNYVESLKGTNPANPKEPQGDKEGA